MNNCKADNMQSITSRFLCMSLEEASELRADLFVQGLKEASAAEADQACGAAGSRDINLISAVQLDAFTAVKYTFRI